MDNLHVIELLPAYALDALDPAETAEVEAHLGDCADCRRELEAYRVLAGDLALAVSSRQPPAGLRQRILQEAAGGRAAPGSSFAGGLAGMKGWFSRLTPVWAAASLVLVLVLLVSNIVLRQQVQQVDQAGEFYVVPMESTEHAPGASGVLVISNSGEDGTLVVDHLPDLGETQQYQLWLIRDGQRTSGGVFSIRDVEDGYGYLLVKAPDSLLSYDSFGVTIEPHGGSPGPTGNKVMGGDL